MKLARRRAAIDRIAVEARLSELLPGHWTLLGGGKTGDRERLVSSGGV